MDTCLLNSCLLKMAKIEKSHQFESVFENFLAFIASFKDVLSKFERNEFLEDHNKATQVENCVVLCFSQLRKSLLMMTSFLKSSLKLGVICNETKSFICKRMILCLEKLSKVSGKDSQNTNINMIDEDEEILSGGSFIAFMDQAISLLAVFEAGLNDANNKEASTFLSQWRTIVDDLLGHAMTIAQVASGLDLKEIQCSCEKILREYESLRKEYEKPKSNVNECKLYTVSLTSALEKLEQRICSAVLRMYLLVFSDSSAPLRDLVRACWEEPGDRGRSANDLGQLVMAFDSHTDRLIQVALFAVACSTSQALVRSIRSCLASLESFDSHIVPALQTLYLRKNDREHLKHFARFLSEHWNDEVQSLNNFINVIVDPVALVQVTYEVAKNPAASLKKAISSGKPFSSDETHEWVNSVVLSVSALVGQLTTMEKSPDIKPSQTLNSAVQDLRKALQHLKESKCLPDSADLSKRCLKRCELVISCLKKVMISLEEELSEESKQVGPPSPLGFPDSARDLPQDVSSALDHLACAPQDSPKSTDSLGPQEPSVKEPSKSSEVLPQPVHVSARSSLRSISILYQEKKVPKRQSTGSKLLRSVLLDNARRGGRRERTSTGIFNRSGNFDEDSSNSSIMQETLGLSALLDNLSTLSERMVPTKQQSSERGLNLDLSDDDYASCVEISVGSGGSTAICTPQRLKDLADLRERIEALRLAHHVP